VAAFLKDTWTETCVEAEAKIVSEAKVFEDLKDYFIEKY